MYCHFLAGIGELPKMIHRPKLPYTEAVLYESMRLASVIPYGAPHQCARDSKIGT